MLDDVFAEVRKFFIDYLEKDPPTYNRAKILALNEETQKDLCAWLMGFRDTYIKEYLEHYNSVEPQVWKYYKQMEVTGTQEQILLAQARRDLLNAWANRPEGLKRGSGRSKSESKTRRPEGVSKSRDSKD